MTRIYWPSKQQLPKCSYEVLSALHTESDIRVNWGRCLDWKDIGGLADYLTQHKRENREGWVYAINHMAQIETAARTGHPFRVIDFFTPNEDGLVEVASVMQVHRTERPILWLHPFFNTAGRRPVTADSLSIH